MAHDVVLYMCDRKNSCLCGADRRMESNGRGNHDITSTSIASVEPL